MYGRDQIAAGCNWTAVPGSFVISRRRARFRPDRPRQPKGREIPVEVYQKNTEEVLQDLNTSAQGLTTQEAEKRLAEGGRNKLAEGKKTSLVVRFFQQMADPMILVLLAAAVLSAITSAYSGESPADVFIILFVVILNSVLGVVQESKAENAIEALKTMAAAQSRVLRDGQIAVVASEELVPGDVILLEAGDAVPADARLLECASLKAEESALTGESVPVTKRPDTLPAGDIALGDRKNMVYMGSTIAYGRGTAVICQTGMNTEMGKIADALTQAKDEATPLQQKLASLSKILTWLVMIICVVIFVVNFLRAGTLSAAVAIDSFMLAISLAVAAIPEGLVAVVTIVLSIGVTRMAKRNAIIRRMTAVETLGCAQVICSDKTGTLTQNKMTVVDSWGSDTQLLARAMSLCSDAELDETNQAVGEPTECALVNYAYTLGLHKNDLKAERPRVAEAPFDSMRKMMSTLHAEDGHVVQYTKGAPDEILQRCDRILTETGVRPITEEDRQAVAAANRDMAGRALRVLAAAERSYDSLPADTSPAALEQGMIFVGLCGMIDPVRPEVRDAVAQCRTAGIRVVMITGDHIDTAIAIARDLDILQDPSQAIRGQELNKLSDEELDAVIDRYTVYARVQPEHKVRIVESWKRKGKIVAMTGDGVNDAPSIKAADIGVGMGITGTDVTKSAADMILADDNFSTIVSAVEEGRKIYSNIRRSIQFLLSSNFSEVIGIFAATMMGFTLLEPTHLLWINLITDSLPALALSMESGGDVMHDPPRDSKEGIFAGGVGIDVVYQGVLVAILTLVAYFVGHWMEAGEWAIVNSPDGTTMAFLTLNMAEIFHAFNMRSRRHSIFTMKKQNKFLWGAALVALLLTGVVIYVPVLAELFDFTSISLVEYLTAMVLAFCIIPLVELVKLLQRRVRG